jgi:DNA gyrase subunit B
MDADELGSTTMEIGKRQIIKVNIEDVEEASNLLSVLMGNNVAPRKEHIIVKSAQRLEVQNG